MAGVPAGLVGAAVAEVTAMTAAIMKTMEIRRIGIVPVLPAALATEGIRLRSAPITRTDVESAVASLLLIALILGSAVPGLVRLPFSLIRGLALPTCIDAEADVHR